MSTTNIIIHVGHVHYTCTATYEINGQYYAQTMEGPEEYPEVEIKSLWIDCQKFDLSEMLDDSDFNDHIIELVLDTLEE